MSSNTAPVVSVLWVPKSHYICTSRTPIHGQGNVVLARSGAGEACDVVTCYAIVGKGSLPEKLETILIGGYIQIPG